MASGWKSGLRAYRLGMPVPLLALATFSFALLVVGAGIYASAFPSMLVAAQSEGEPKVRANLFVAGDSGVGLGLNEPEPAELADGTDVDAASDDSEASGVKGLATLASPGAVKGSSSLQSAAVSGGQGGSPSASGSGSGAAGSESSSSGSHAGSASGGSGAGGSSSGGSNTPSTPGGGSSNAGGSGSGTTTDKNPPAEQENAAHEFMLSSLSGLDGYVNDVNECVAAFNNHALTADLATRQTDFKHAEKVWSKIRSSFASVLNYTPISNHSKWRPAQEGLVGAHRCLSEYLACYLNAWEKNVEYDSPAEHEGEFMDDLKGAEAKLSEFNSYYGKVSL